MSLHVTLLRFTPSGFFTFHPSVLMRPLLLLLTLASPLSAQAPPFDVVISGGRVIDPASNLDAVRNVGIRDGKVVIVTDAPLTGRIRIDAGGLVVAPG